MGLQRRASFIGIRVAGQLIGHLANWHPTPVPWDYRYNCPVASESSKPHYDGTIHCEGRYPVTPMTRRDPIRLINCNVQMGLQRRASYIGLRVAGQLVGHLANWHPNPVPWDYRYNCPVASESSKPHYDGTIHC